MGAPVLIINGLELPQLSRLDLQQTFEIDEGGTSDRRLANGSLFVMSNWTKWKTTLSGAGWVPAPLLSLPRGVAFELHSVAPLALSVGEALPAGWAARTDWPEKTIIDRRGVEVRLVYPILTVKTVSGARLVTGGNMPQWELVCREG